MDMNQVMRQAQKLQREMEKKQQELAAKTFEASSGGGMVTVRVNGKHEVLELKIEPEVVDKNDIAMLQDLTVAAINEANRKAQEEVQKEMAAMMGGFNVPGLFN